MDRFDEVPSYITNAWDYAEYAEYQEKKEKHEKHYKEKPIEQNNELLLKINKLQDSIDESFKQKK